MARSRPAQTWSLPQSCPAVGLQTRSPSNPEFEERVGGTAAVAIPPCLASRWNWLCNDKAGRSPNRRCQSVSWATVNITTSHRQHARLAQAVDQDIRFGGTRKARWFGEQGWSVTRLGTGRGARYGSLGRSGNCRRSGRRWSMGRHMRGGVDQ